LDDVSVLCLFLYKKLSLLRYTQHRDTQEVLQTLDKLDIDDDALNNEEELYKRFGYTDDYLNRSLSKWQKLKPKIWRIFDEPSSSQAAKVIIPFVLKKERESIHLRGSCWDLLVEALKSL
jgi:hypothetical protein